MKKVLALVLAAMMALSMVAVAVAEEQTVAALSAWVLVAKLDAEGNVVETVDPETDATYLVFYDNGQAYAEHGEESTVYAVEIVDEEKMIMTLTNEEECLVSGWNAENEALIVTIQDAEGNVQSALVFNEVQLEAAE